MSDDITVEQAGDPRMVALMRAAMEAVRKLDDESLAFLRSELTLEQSVREDRKLRG